MKRTSQPRPAFTLIELLVVISIIAVLMGLAFPVFQGVQNTAKKTQAKNDLVQIVTAVNAFYTEYGRYPITTDNEGPYGLSGNPSKPLLDELRGLPATINTRGIVFFSPPDARDQTTPRGGIGNDGQFYDPWNKPYVISIDADYNNEVTNPFSATSGWAPKVRAGVIAWSFGKDRDTGNDKNASPGKDDVISWQ